MFDIVFFKKMHSLKQSLVKGDYNIENADEVVNLLESEISVKPYVFNIETTNFCNMTCIMCPRTTEMDRHLEDMKMNIFDKIVDEITPHSDEEWNEWVDFVSNELNIKKDEMSENNFYFYISARAITLHGYGEPVLDPMLVERVQKLTNKGIPSYLSCNPANIKLDNMSDLMKAGLTYIKFSLDSLSDEGQKEKRGFNADFTTSYKLIKEVLDMKEKNNFDTKIVITMIEMDSTNREEVKDFMDLWKDLDVYSYIKSQDNRWYYEEDTDLVNKSHYEHQYCEYPWTSLTVMADGSIVPCTQDFNNELTFGNINNNTLQEIWGSEAYKEFRRKHVVGVFEENFKCSDRCDQILICNYIKE